ncbi:MAG: transporter [Mucilaginibacter sp.]|nr:transporter [Mucilaginibacter sp.]
MNKPSPFRTSNKKNRSAVSLKAAPFFRRSIGLMLGLYISIGQVRAQDPVLPPTNLGSANIFDGFAGEPGFVYQTFAQSFMTRGLYNSRGEKLPTDLKVNSTLVMNQLIYMSKVKVLNGNLGFTLLIPAVQINASAPEGNAPSVNPNVLADPTWGTFIQWPKTTLFGKPIYQRTEIDVTLPVGSYDNRYTINASSHLWFYSVYHALTLMVDKRFSISTRNQFNYSSRYIGGQGKPGAFYNGNYSLEYLVLPKVRVEAVAYFLKQVGEDSYNGDHQYYQRTFGTGSTKEKVLSIGPGIAYFVQGGPLVEAKIFFESDVRQRFGGTRPTVRILMPL